MISNNRAAWRAVATIVVLIVFAIEIVSFLTQGDFGFDTHLRNSHVEVVSSVYARPSPLRVGDTIDDRLMDFGARVLQHGARAGQTVTLPINRDGQLRSVSLTASSYIPSSSEMREFLLALVWKLNLLGIGLFMFARGRGKAARYLAIACIGWALNGGFLYLAALPVWAYFALLWGLRLFVVIANGAFYLFIEQVCAGLIPPRVTRAVRTIVVVLLALQLLRFWLPSAIYLFTGNALSAVSRLDVVSLVLLAVTMGYCTLGYARSAGLQRQRLAWVFWCELLGFCGDAIVYTASIFARQWHGFYAQLPDAIPVLDDVTSILMVAGLSYAILRHRVVDVAFVFNRTLVYGALVALIVGTISVAESIIEHATFGHRDSVMIQLSAALMVGVIIHPVRTRVEAMSDRLFFRRKAKIQDFIKSVVDDPRMFADTTALSETATTRLHSILGVREVALYEDRGTSFGKTSSCGADELPASVPKTDKVVLEAANCPRVVEIGRVEGAFSSSGLVFPLALRSQLLGLIVCVEDVTSMPLDSKEQSAVSTLAHELATQLHAIRTLG